jgi:hypothetical protein
VTGTAIAALGMIVIVVGIIAMVLGLYVSLADRKKKLEGQFQNESLSASDTINAFARCLEALKDYPPGQQLFFGGLLATIVGALISGVGGITS